MSATRKAYRAAILHSIADPAEVGLDASHEYYEDGLLVVEDGRISALGHASDLLPRLGTDVEVIHHQHALITPGFIDTHIHFPQTGMIGSYGEQLLDWLNTYTFPCEKQFADKAHADQVAKIFLKELLRNGTTSALVFGSVHPESVDALFEEAQRLDLRLIAGKVMMDRNAPDYLTDTAESSYAQSKALIERWHGKGRLHYAVTPRFAPTSTPEQLALAGQLLKEYPVCTCTPTCRRTSRKSTGSRHCSLSARATGRLRPLRTAGRALGVRPRRAPVRRRVPAPGRHRFGCGLLPHLQPVPGQRTVQPASGRALQGQRGPGHRRGRRHQLRCSTP